MSASVGDSDVSDWAQIVYAGSRADVSKLCTVFPNSRGVLHLLRAAIGARGYIGIVATPSLRPYARSRIVSDRNRNAH